MFCQEKSKKTPNTQRQKGFNEEKIKIAKVNTEVNGTTSSEAQVRSGIPQGSVLGSLLFLIQISDINYEISDSTVSCFAEDTRILLVVKDEEDIQMLQNESHKLYKWADTNNMKFNGNKFEL